ncbi:helicase C-terminal domain-containing protein [Umbelopsis sp. AD052]|nr:helicase C-terminal domain-containing protein [Umbelopsis sp. AD052]
MSEQDFGFPFKPYDIQEDFMKELYNVLDQGKIGIFESPTGTGKSLSLLCGSLRWLYDQEHVSTPTTAAEKKDGAADEPDWLKQYTVQHEQKTQQSERQLRRQELQARIDRARKREESEHRNKSAWIARQHVKKTKTAQEQGNLNDSEDSEFLLEEYDSDDTGNADGRKKPSSAKSESQSNLSADVQELLRRLDNQNTLASASSNDNIDTMQEDEDEVDELKIFFTSRTHSQLSQFIREVQKTKYADSLHSVGLSSRKNLCINKDVQKLNSVHRINEQCLELQKKSSGKRCECLPTVSEKGRLLDFRDHALAKVRDIEELVDVGKSLNTCPYYGTRKTIKPAQLVTLPYQHLLHKTTRESLGISLKNNIVIIDEAHNLIDTINSIHTITIHSKQMRTALSQLSQYLQRYKSRLLGKNIVYIKQIIMIVKAMIKFMENAIQQSKNSNKNSIEKVLNINEFVHQLGIDHLNMFKIEKYLKESKLARKLNGFLDMKKKKDEHDKLNNPVHETENDPSVSSVPILNQIEALLMALTNADKDGRIIVACENDDEYIQYMLLNPANEFKAIVEEARSVVLAGGTMEPMSDFLTHLFPYAEKDRIHKFSCGHIIPKENLQVLTVGTGPTGQKLIYNFEHRSDTKLIDQTGQIIANLCNVIPDGVVCFFASYPYLELVYQRWSRAESGNILDRISKKKKIFREPRAANMVDATLRDYTLQVDTGESGAILFCVVNGKMSEGINFSDRLGRAVIMVGLPFANLASAALVEKIKYVKEHANAQGASGDAGKEYYENLCMRAVNQSIGRAIRHKNDFATVLLLDERYDTTRIQNKLPGWIRESVYECKNFGLVMSRTASFFKDKRQQ